MNNSKKTVAGETLSNLILDLFKLNNSLITAGDRLVSDVGLTSTRWQVMGNITLAEWPQSVAWLARNMGANRQNIQRIVNALEKEGLVTFQDNPHHKRSQLVILTDKGSKTYMAAMQLHYPWVNELSKELQVEELKIMHKIVLILHKKLKADLDCDT
jgi:DNA-binding MarR family transcriptional regulator